MNSGIILMAGSGERSHLDYNKVLYNYLGKPLFIHSLDAFYHHPKIDEVFLVINKQDEENIKKMLDSYDNIVIVYGGKTRNESLKNALEKMGHEVYIVTANLESFKYEYNEEERVLKVPGVPTGIYDSRLTSIYPIQAVIL